MTLHLHGLGHFHPSNEISNRFLEELDIGTDEEWILSRVGIRSRRTSLDLDYIRQTRNSDPRAALEASHCTSAEMGAHAARMAMSRANVRPEDIGLVIAGGCSPDTTTPAEACNAAAMLDIEATALDINSACTSHIAAVRLLAAMRAEELPDFVLLLSMEPMTRTVNYRDRGTAVLWGDGATAAVVSPRHGGRGALLSPVLASTPASHNKVVVPRGGHFWQDGSAVQRFAIRRMAQVYESLREQREETDRPLHFVGHQANLRMLEAVYRRCNISEERRHSNVEVYGNTGAAGSVSVLSEHWHEWGDGDEVALVGVGAGLTWGGHLVRFQGVAA